MLIAIPIGMKDDKYTINKAYVTYVAGAGYDPLIVSPPNNPKIMASLADGLLLPGGIDIDPLHYGENNLASFWCDPEKDSFERDLLWEFITAEKPVFGICRGFQLIAREYMSSAWAAPVSAGAKVTVGERLGFIQHVDSHEMTGRFNLMRRFPHHLVNARTDLLYGAEKKLDRIAVNSMHHQAVYLDLSNEWLENRSNKISNKAQALAWTYRGLDEDDYPGVICEAIRIENWAAAPIMGVQWHPEELQDYALLRNFFGAPTSAPAVQEMRAE